MQSDPSYVRGSTDISLSTETIGSTLRRTVELFGDREALVVCSQRYRATYRELWAATTALAKALIFRGIKKGDRVGIWAPNRYEWVIVQHATARIGAILVNVNPAYKARELEYALNQSELRLLILARQFRKTDYRDILQEVRTRCVHLQQTVIIDDEWNSLLNEATEIDDAALTHRENSLTCHDPINIQYTSGTTGSPKGATLSHHNILNNGHICGAILSYTEKDRVCIPLPFYHCFGMVMGNLACASHGACVVVPGEAFDAGDTLAAIDSERCTSVYGVPTMFIAQLNHPKFNQTDVSSLRTGIMGGSPCPVEVMKQVRDRMNIREMTICYGMTETSPVSTQTRRDDALQKRVSTVGRVHPHVEIQIVNPETGQIVPRGESGELCTRGYSVMLGYWNDASATNEAVDTDGWMHTRDLALMDEDGYLRIVGRLTDMIIRGGENIYPREIEEFLYTHPDIEDAQVIGVPSKMYGEEVMAWIKLKADTNVTDEALTAYCRGQIATTKIPVYWKRVDEFPMTVTGKVQKFRMRELAKVELGLGDAAGKETA